MDNRVLHIIMLCLDFSECPLPLQQEAQALPNVWLKLFQQRRGSSVFQGLRPNAKRNPAPWVSRNWRATRRFVLCWCFFNTAIGKYPIESRWCMRIDRTEKWVMWSKFTWTMALFFQELNWETRDHVYGEMPHKWSFKLMTSKLGWLGCNIIHIISRKVSIKREGIALGVFVGETCIYICLPTSVENHVPFGFCSHVFHVQPTFKDLGLPLLDLFSNSTTLGLFQ